MEGDVPEEQTLTYKDTPSVVRRPFLSSITETESIAEESACSLITNTHEKPISGWTSKLSNETSPFSTATTNCSNSAVSPINSLECLKKPLDYWVQVMPEEMFKIRNLDTGEEIDLRDENKEKFIHKITSVLRLNTAKLHSVLQFYVTKRYLNEQLWQAAELGDADACRNLLNRETTGNILPSPNTKGLNDWTALHLAANEGFLNVCEVLVYEGEMTNLDARTSMNRTPLHLASMRDHVDVIKLLISEGADIDAIDTYSNTPIHYASQHGHSDCVKRLLKQGASYLLKNNLNQTACDVSGSIEVYEVFLNYYTQSGIVLLMSDYSRTPFYNVLIRNSREDHVNKLLHKGLTRPAPSQLLKLYLLHSHQRSQLKQLSRSEIRRRVEYLSKTHTAPQDFEGIGQLGKGSFGQVFLVKYRGNGKLYAMKILNKDRIFGKNYVETNLVKYAYTERNILSTIQHPFIVKLNFAFQTPEKLALVMDYCAGGDLGHQLAKDKKFSEEKAKFYICEILLALEELHSHGIIFRDLKPENVVLDSEGHAHLTDFGLSKEGIYGNQFTKSFCGSIAYLAPEMLRRKGHDKSVDWYLLGVLLYEMLTGVPPYYSINREQLFYNIQKGKLHMPRFVSEPAKNLILKLLHRDPKKRLGYQRDSEELKEQEFFDDINWLTVIRKEVPGPSFHMPKHKSGNVNLEKVFGSIDRRFEMGKLKGWSFIDTRRISMDCVF